VEAEAKAEAESEAHSVSKAESEGGVGELPGANLESESSLMESKVLGDD